jgi:hypothetical protein
LNSTQKSTLEAIFAKPTLGSIKFSSIESLIVALGGTIHEGAGSRVALHLSGFVKHAHRPHPGKEAKRYQVEEIRHWLESLGIKP